MQSATRIATIALLAVLLGGPAAGAASFEITVGPLLQFTPAAVAIAPGDVVTFTQAGGGAAAHNVLSEDGLFSIPAVGPTAEAFSEARAFDVPGRYGFRCAVHGDLGMVGAVVVRGVAADAAPAEPAGSVLDATAPVLSAVRPIRRRAGVTLTLKASEPARLSGRLERRTGSGRGRYSSFGRLRFDVAPGVNRLDFTATTAGRRLGPGDYRLTLIAEDRARNASRAHVVRFLVRPS